MMTTRERLIAAKNYLISFEKMNYDTFAKDYSYYSELIKILKYDYTNDITTAEISVFNSIADLIGLCHRIHKGVAKRLDETKECSLLEIKTSNRTIIWKRNDDIINYMIHHINSVSSSILNLFSTLHFCETYSPTDVKLFDDIISIDIFSLITEKIISILGLIILESEHISHVCPDVELPNILHTAIPNYLGSISVGYNYLYHILNSNNIKYDNPILFTKFRTMFGDAYLN